MTDLSTNEVHSRILAAFFDTREAAQKATTDLVAAGIPREHVRLTEGADAGTAAATTTATHDARSFWEELKDMFLPDEDRYGYAEGLRRGGYLLSIRSDEANYTRVMDILDRDGAIDMDTREATWRASGWTGYQPGIIEERRTSSATTTGTTAGVGVGAAALSAKPATAPRPAGSSASVGTLQDGRDDVIPIYEETASVAKRDVNHGRVRLRSYVVETPFSQQVSLRHEQVEVERRPVDRPIGGTDALFQDRVIELEEHDEEAIISKEARVKEEISLRKTVENRSQTLTDTVRHTEVEVEDTRHGHVAAGAQGVTGVVDASRIIEHMPVIASDGTQVGTVDHMDGPDKIKLAKNTSPDGQHHYVPLTWVDHIDAHVHLNRATADVHANW